MRGPTRQTVCPSKCENGLEQRHATREIASQREPSGKRLRRIGNGEGGDGQMVRRVHAAEPDRADEAIASAALAYPYHGGCRTCQEADWRCGGGRSRRKPPQERDHPSTRSPRNSPASRGATASNAMGTTSWCSAVPHWRLRGPSPVASVATSCLWKPTGQRGRPRRDHRRRGDRGVPPELRSKRSQPR
jgi:hypothetical protein